MEKDLVTLGEQYRIILIHSILADGLEVTQDGIVDLSTYDKPVKAPDFVKQAIHGTTLDINEAVLNFQQEVAHDPQHKCKAFTEQVTAAQGEKLRKEVEAYFQGQLFDGHEPIGFSALQAVIDFFDPLLAGLGLSEPPKQSLLPPMTQSSFGHTRS